MKLALGEQHQCGYGTSYVAVLNISPSDRSSMATHHTEHSFMFSTLSTTHSHIFMLN